MYTHGYRLQRKILFSFYVDIARVSLHFPKSEPLTVLEKKNLVCAKRYMKLRSRIKIKRFANNLKHCEMTLSSLAAGIVCLGVQNKANYVIQIQVALSQAWSSWDCVAFHLFHDCVMISWLRVTRVLILPSSGNHTLST